MTRNLILWSMGCLAVVPAIVAQQPAQPSQPARAFTPRTVIPRAIRPIVDAPMLPAHRVSDQVSDNELVLGVVVNDEARAYPINMLTGPQREIINDRLGGVAIAATW